MPTSLSTTLKKLESVSETNRVILRDFHGYMLSKDPKSERHIISLLTLLISLDMFHGGLPFTSINSQEQILTFLNHRYDNKGKWVERVKDAEGKYIGSFNLYLELLKTFFRWLYNKDRPEDFSQWETPPFLKIKAKKPLRSSPYSVNEIWQLDELLTIVEYESRLRNKAILTLLWDLDARNHEITALRIKDIVLNEQYGEGSIPSNTKTGGGPILLTSSFTYVRDWINKHPFKNEPNARLICNLNTGAPIKPDVVGQVLNQLRSKITRITKGSGVTDVRQRQKLEHLLRTKKWNPYCFRHSAITDDSDHLPEYALKKKVRWVMGSKQATRYIKQRMGDELKNKILERHGIKVTALGKPQMVSRICGRCGYVNNLESKYCEAKGCNYPLTPEAYEEIKAAEQSKLQQLVDKSNLERDNTIQALQQELKSKTQEMQSLSELCTHSLELSSKQNGTISDYKGMVDDVKSRYDELMGLYENLKSKFDTSVSITKTAFERIDELQTVMRGGDVLIRPDRRTAEELQRRAKILLQVAPDWQKRTAPVNARLTPEEERKVMELINQPS